MYMHMYVCLSMNVYIDIYILIHEHMSLYLPSFFFIVGMVDLDDGDEEEEGDIRLSLDGLVDIDPVPAVLVLFFPSFPPVPKKPFLNPPPKVLVAFFSSSNLN